MPKILVTDVDNTLFDWQEVWYKTFSAMMNEVIRISGADPEVLYSESSLIHQKYGTSEYSGILEELPALRALYGDNIRSVMASAIDKFRQVRRETLKLYPNVMDTLLELNSRDVRIAAFTESKAFYTIYRFKRLGLDGVIDTLYSPQDHDVPNHLVSERKYPESTYKLEKTSHHYTPDGEVKPNPHILKSIISDMGADAQDVVYVGDNLLKDVYMAQQANVLDVFASYGAAQHRPEYDLLRKVTHWTPEMVERERKAILPGIVEPTVTIQGFQDILKLF